VSAREQIVTWRRAQRALVCDRVEPWRLGTLFASADFPVYYDYNVLRVEGGDPGVDAAALAGVADELQDGLEHRRIEVDDEDAGRRLRPGFEALGWRADRLAWLRRPATPPWLGAPEGATVRPAAFEETRSLRIQWKTEDPMGGNPAEIAVIEEAAAARRGVRAVLAEAGGPVGFAAFSAAGDLAEVELAFCLAEHRGRGIGGAVVAGAVGAAEAGGAREVLIAADDDGDSRRLYERLGFRSVWPEHVFTRMPAES